MGHCFIRQSYRDDQMCRKLGQYGFPSRIEKRNGKTLIVHGDSDNIVPIDTAGKQAAQGIINNDFMIIEGAPHGLNVTHAEELNGIISRFLTSQ